VSDGAMSQKRGSSGWPGRVGFRHGSALLPHTNRIYPVGTSSPRIFSGHVDRL
jgi:hypothetical protein